MREESPILYVIVEGVTDEPVVTKLLHHTGIESFLIQSLGGKSNILKRLSGYNRSSAGGSNWLVIVDLDNDADCAPRHLKELLFGRRSENLSLRVAVRSMESWLLADCEGMRKFTGIRASRFPSDPESELHPKRYFIDLIERECKKERLRKGLLPSPHSNRLVGPGYTHLMQRFAMKHWRPEVAARRSDSLARCIRALEELKRQSVQ